MIGESWEDRLANLPRQLVVAIAARCAKRVEPLALRYFVDLRGPDGKQRAIAVSEAIESASAYAAGDGKLRSGTASIASGDAADAGYAAEAAAHATEAATETVNETVDKTVARAAARAADTAAAAAAAAYAAAYASMIGADRATMLASDAIGKSIGAAFYTGSLEIAKYAADADIKAAGVIAKSGVPYVDTGPTGPFGTYWPKGTKPDWFCEVAIRDSGGDETKSPIAGPLSVYIDSDVYSAEEKGELLSLISELYTLQNGDRLTIDVRGSAAAAVVNPDGGGQ